MCVCVCACVCVSSCACALVYECALLCEVIVIGFHFLFKFFGSYINIAAAGSCVMLHATTNNKLKGTKVQTLGAVACACAHGISFACQMAQARCI